MKTKPTYEELEQRVAELENVVDQYKRPDDACRKKPLEETDSERRFRTVAEQSPNMLFINREDRIVYANKRAAEIMGYQLDELYSPAFNFLSLIAPESFKKAELSFKKNMEKIEIPPREYTLCRKDGSIVNTIANTKLIDYEGENATLVVFTDITWQKRLENTLRESEKKYRKLFYTVSDPIMIFDAKTLEFIDANNAVSALYGYSKDEFLKLRNSDIIAEPQESNDSINKTLSGKITKVPIRYHRHKDGTVFPVEISSGRFKMGERQLVCGVVRDITERTLAEIALQESEGKFRNLFESSIDPVYINSFEGSFIDVNQAFLDLFGYSRDELTGLNILNLYVNPAARTTLLKNMVELKYIKDYEVKLKSKNGQILNCLVTANARFNDDGSIDGYQGIIRDVTEKRKAEVALLKSREDLRNLSSKLLNAQEEERRRISLELHDEMGQSLTAIGLSLTEIKEELNMDLELEIEDKFRELSSIILNASEQVSKMSLDLRPAMLDDLGLIPTLRWYIHTIAKISHLEIEFISEVTEDCLNTEITTVLYRISQEALNNIVKHADAEHVSVRLEEKQKKIILEIKDDGKGFDITKVLLQSEKNKIGLVGMQERASILGGNLHITSCKPHGTRVVVDVPLH